MSETMSLGLTLLMLTAALGANQSVNAGARPSGVVEGSLKVTAPARQASGSAGSGSNAFYDGDFESTSVKVSTPEEVVVYLKGVPGNYLPPAGHVHLDQKFLQFTHRVVPVLKGTVVDFTNHDPVYHNVFTNSKANKFDLGRKGYGQKSSVKMTQSEVPVNVYCEIHSTMKSNILVLDNPFFTTVKPGKKFRLEGVPPGTYSLVAWHDYWAPVERTVTVKKGEVIQVNLTLDRVQK